MKDLLQYLRDYKKECVLGPFFKLLEAVFDLIVPAVTAAIIDKGIANRDEKMILGYGGILLLLAAVGLICSITAQYFAAKAATGFAAKLRYALFRHVESLSFTEMDEVGTSTLITRMTSDVNQLQSGVNMALRLFLRSPFIVLGAMIMAFTYDVRIAFIFVVAIILLSVVIFGIMAICTPLYKKVQGILDQVLQSTRENLTGVRVIRAFRREDEEEEEYQEKTGLLMGAQIFVGRISALTNTLTYVIVNGALVLLLWRGGLRIQAGSLYQGQIVALVNYLSQILVELVKLANTIVLTNKSLASAERIVGVFEMRSSLEEAAGENFLEKNISEQKIRVVFDHASLCYKGALEASVRNVNLVVKKGETIGIIGGTGSGKTSLVSLIPRFYDATEGKVLVDGVDVREQSVEGLRRKIGIVMQKAVLFKGTIRENLLWGNENATEEELIEALKISQAWEFVEKKEKGLDSFVEQGGRNLSGGQRQRLSIARALVRKPEILIFDDSTSALDYATDAKLRRGLKHLSYRPVIFMVSQRTSSIRHADQILVLEDGRVLDIGTHEELLARSKEYQEIHESQFKNVGEEEKKHA
ncbi:MAG: ABC transporter ATP-binding protein [Lachnospiraceae bacterium]|nr:ABC transporter ATP-binding protein [Lachnospiraceae bacterium]